MVYDPETDEVVAESMAARGFAPASNNKLLTTAIAMESLGLDHRFVTRVATTVDPAVAVSRGRLAGDLVLIGGGDPTFGEEVYAEKQWQAIATALREKGIQRIGGRVRGVSSWNESSNRGHGWQWDYLDDDYAAPFGGLCMAGNALKLRVQAHQGYVKITTTPPLADQVDWVINRITLASAAKDQQVRVSRRLGRQEIEVEGVLRPGSMPSEYRVAISDPITFAEAVATTGLQTAGVLIEGASTTPSAEGKVELLTIESPSISQIAGPLLTHSDNLYAEQLFRGAAHVNRASASNSSARAHAYETLGKLDVDTRGLVMADGSGLSRRNLVQPRQLVQLLRSIRRRPYAARFLDCLPVAGVSGTLRERLAFKPARERVRAKTGFISRVVCLSGYLLRDDQEPLIFSVMLNDFTCETAKAKAACDRFVQRLAASYN